MCDPDPSVADAAGDAWNAMGFVNHDGDVISAWSCPLPVGFAHRVVNDPDGLGRQIAERASMLGGEVVESGQMTVDGRAAFYRIVRLPAGELLSAAYVVGLVVPLEDIPPGG